MFSQKHAHKFLFKIAKTEKKARCLSVGDNSAEINRQ